MKTTAILEMELPRTCIECPLWKSSLCKINRNSVFEFAYRRHPDCQLKTIDNSGYDDYIRIGHQSDALSLLQEMIEKCNLKPSPDYNDIEKKMFNLVIISQSYFLPRLEDLKDALEHGII